MIHQSKKIFFCILSCVLCSAGLNWVALPNGFPATGIAGLSMVLAHFTGQNYTVMYYLITLLILGATLLVLGKDEVKSILFLSVLYPAILWLLNRVTVEIVFQERLIAVALFGVLYGAGSGIVLRIGFSYGGLDTSSKILKRLLLPTMELRNVMLLIDGGIMLLMLTTYSFETLVYAFLGQLVTVNVMNYVLFHMGPKLYDVQIVANRQEEIRTYMIETLHKTMSSHPITGAYTGAGKIEMDCVCTSKEYIRLRAFLVEQEIDCFVKVMPLMHVFGTNRDFEKLSDEVL